MAITLASDSLSDAAVTDGIGRGDLSAAARLWVRHWAGALAASRLYVERREVPGLAAEALIGTISMTALGRGPRENVSAFVSSAVRELGEEDEPPPVDIADLDPVYASPRLTRCFADLTPQEQHALRDLAEGNGTEQSVDALTVLQTHYLATHLDDAPTRECRPVHVAMIAAAEGRLAEGFAGNHWLHMSTCAWCTEAFHELSFSNVALDALIAPSVLGLAGAPLTPMAEEIAEPALAAVDAALVEPVETPGESGVDLISVSTSSTSLVEEPEEEAAHRAGVHTVVRGGRQRIFIAAALTAAVAVAAVILSQNLGGTDDPTAPTAAEGSSTPSYGFSVPTPSATSTDGTDAFSDLDEPLPPSPALPDAEVAGPLASPTSTPEDEETEAPPAPKPTKTPSASPTPTPSASPTPTPSASPTRSCNDLQHLLGFC